MSSGANEFIKDFSQYLVSSLVDAPLEVLVDVTMSTKNIMVQIKCKDTDLGKIIGKKGRTIDSIKVILSAVKNSKFANDNRKVMIEVIEPENSTFRK